MSDFYSKTVARPGGITRSNASGMSCPRNIWVSTDPLGRVQGDSRKVHIEIVETTEDEVNDCHDLCGQRLGLRSSRRVRDG